MPPPRFGPRLVGRIVHHRLVDGAWTAREGIAFSFLDAELDELFPGAA